MHRGLFATVILIQAPSELGGRNENNELRPTLRYFVRIKRKVTPTSPTN